MFVVGKKISAETCCRLEQIISKTRKKRKKECFTMPNYYEITLWELTLTYKSVSLKILEIYIYNKNPSNPTIARIIEKPTPMPKMIVFPFPPDDTPSFIPNPNNS